MGKRTESWGFKMKKTGLVLALISGTICVGLLRSAFPEADKAFLMFIDQNIVLIFSLLIAFFAYGFWLLVRHRNSDKT
jgi:hypothetical protein